MSKPSGSPCCLGLNLYALSVYSPSFPSGLESRKSALSVGLISLVPFFCLHSADRRVFSARLFNFIWCCCRVFSVRPTLFNFISFRCLSLVSSSQSPPLLSGPPCDVYGSPESVFFLSLRGISFSDFVCILFRLLGPVIHRLSRHFHALCFCYPVFELGVHWRFQLLAHADHPHPVSTLLAEL